MNAKKIITISSQGYIGFSALSLAYVSMLSIYSPQLTMNLVATPLPNTDAISSIRGIYGGVGLVIVFTLIDFLLNDIRKGLIFLSLFWGAYSISRLITIWVDGALGNFGSQWMVIEASFCMIALVLLLLSIKIKREKS